jgi:hypothetical protein
MLPDLPKDFKPKSFWEKPEGTTGMVINAILVVAGGIGLFVFGPAILMALKTAAGIVTFGAILFAMLWVLFDPRFRNLAFYAYKSIARAITQIFVQIDPIGILKTYLETLKKNAEQMFEQLGNLKGQLRRLKIMIDTNAQKMQDALKMAGKAKEMNKQAIVVLKARKAGRLEQSNVTLSDLYTRMEVLYRVLTKMYETCLVLVEDMDDEITVKEQEHEMITTSYGVLKRAMKIIHGDKDGKEMYDQAMEYLASDYGKKVGEIEHFITMSASFMDSIDLQNGIYEDEALKKLEQWEKDSDSILLGDQKQLLIAQAQDTTAMLDLNAPLPDKEKVIAGREEKKEKSDYGKFFAETR